MDRRQLKTRQAIISAFNQLLLKNNYNNITIQQIIDKANIGRSTFYSHYETKDTLLISICTEIFEHIFEYKLPEQTNQNSVQNLKLELSHILYHLKDSDIDIKNILKSESQQIFLNQFRIHVEKIFSNYLNQQALQIPLDFSINFLVEAFISTTSWWITSNSIYSPEDISDFYIKMVENNL